MAGGAGGLNKAEVNTPVPTHSCNIELWTGLLYGGVLYLEILLKDSVSVFPD